jgi:glycosyltransferase involved in cell wall biosynthesis
MSQDPLYLLCAEPTFPGRLGAVADWLVRRRGYRCQFFCASADAQPYWPASAGRGLDVIQFNIGGVAREPAVAWTRLLERSLCYASGLFEVLHARRPQPVDLILGRSIGLGSTLFAPVFQAAAPVVNYFDYYYHAHAHDLTAELVREVAADYFHWRRAANVIDLLDLENVDLSWTATAWQRDLYPAEYRDDFLVLYDGVNSQRFQRAAAGAAGRVRLVAGRMLQPDVRLITFVARSLDRVRGFDRFMALANRLLQRRKDIVCAVIGNPVVQRGLDVPFFNRDYRAAVLAEFPGLDSSRLWFCDNVPPGVVADVLAASDLHVYPARTYPVARSLLEAMSAGCVVLAWDTEPVKQVIAHGQNGLLVSADNVEEQERLALAALDDPGGHRSLGDAAAATVRERYAQDVTLPVLAERFSQLVQRQR